MKEEPYQKISIDPSYVKMLPSHDATDNEDSIKKIQRIINTGRAILFTGAGFSVGCKNINNTTPPRADELAKLIYKKGNFDEEESDPSLGYASELFMEQRNKSDLIDILRENFTMQEIGREHEKILSFCWKRIYTTNYDDSIEKAATKNGKIMHSLTLDDNPKEFYKKENCCIHINGNISSSISEEDLNSKIKLSRTSYISPDSFENSAWYYYFKKDLEQCSAIVFIGYSLYDIDIEKILFSTPKFKDKTYFITSENESGETAHRLKKYGKLLKIGVKGFSDKIDTMTIPKSEFWLDCFQKYTLTDQYTSITDDQISNFMLYGNLDKSHIDSAISSEQSKPYLIERSVLSLINEGYPRKNLAILSDLGNGKSIILQEMMSTLAILGYEVFFLQNEDGDYANDIEKIDKLNKEAFLFIDNYSLYYKTLLYIFKFNSNRIRVIFSDRTNVHDRFQKKLIDEGVEFDQLNVDLLDNKESDFFIKIINNLGLWGNRAVLSLKTKDQYIKDYGKGQVSHILLDLFNSPQIQNRIDLALSPLMKNENFKITIFSICLLEIINLPLTLSLISEVSGTNFIYNTEVMINENFNQIFRIEHNNVISKSSLFSTYLLNNSFTAPYTTDKLLALATKYNNLKNNGTAEKSLFTSLMRFSFIERLLPQKGKLDSLIKYYEDLKVRVPELIHHPHFWLQYGMARMSSDQLDKAQSNLTQAYALTNKLENYDNSYIDTQQARLHILFSLKESNGPKAWELFQKAHNLLIRLDDNTYKYRQISLYKDFFEKKYDILSKKNKEQFKVNVSSVIKHLQKFSHITQQIGLYSNYQINSCQRYLTEILSKIEA